MPRIPLITLSESEISGALLKSAEGVEYSSFGLGVSCAKEEQKLACREKCIAFLCSSGKQFLKDGFEIYFLVHLDRGFVESTPEPVYVKGRYNKFSRLVAQTFHYCFRCRGSGCRTCNGTGKLSSLSVQEILEKTFLPAFGARESKFHGCGREDVDVRMLGAGRPFVLELVLPQKRAADLDKLGKNLNESAKDVVAVSSLAFCEKSEVEKIKNGSFEKIYGATCVCESGVSNAEVERLGEMEIDITQRTPERVEKRRADIERPKHAKIVSAKVIDATHFSIEIFSSHGLYIKEFVSGDNGRTIPSVSSILGKPCACAELDVLEIIGKEN